MRTLPAGWRAPQPPRTLGRTGRRWWRVIWRGGKQWLDESIDVLLIEQVCIDVDQVATIEAHLVEVGRWYTTKQGVIAAHPGVAMIRQLDAGITSRLSLLGFSPTDRARLNLTMRTDDDDLARFRQRNDASRRANLAVVDPLAGGAAAVRDESLHQTNTET